MQKKKRFSPIKYIFLPFCLLLIIISFFYPYHPKLQYNITIWAVGIYILVGLLDHYLDKSLTFETWLEYILIGSLAAIVVTGAFNY